MCICFVLDNMRDIDRGYLGMKFFIVKKLIYCLYGNISMLIMNIKKKDNN